MADFSDAKLNEIIDTGYEFKGSEYISRALAIFKQAPGAFIGFILLGLVIVSVLGMIPFVNIIVNFLSPVLFAGVYIVARKVQTKQGFEFSNFFDGFKRNPGQIVIATLIMGLIALVCAIPMIAGMVPMLSSGEPSAMFFIGVVVSMALIFYLMVSWLFTVQFIIFYDLEAWPAMQASMKVVKGKWWSVFGFVLLLALLNIVGAICLFVGLLVSMPVTQISMYTAFADITRMNEESQMDIMDHLVDEEQI